MKRIGLSILALSLLVTIFGSTSYGQNYKIRWKVLGGGGASATFENGMKLSGTAVQTAIGDVQTPTYTIAQGFWNKAIAPCRRGDADGNGSSSISDAVYIVNYIFVDGPAPVTSCGGDSDGNGYVNISDAVWLIRYIFLIP